VKVKKRDIGLTLLFLLGFLITYAEGRLIMLANYLLDGNVMWLQEAFVRSLAWMIVFGVPHSMGLYELALWIENRGGLRWR